MFIWYNHTMNTQTSKVMAIPEPKVAQALFASPRFAAVWLVVRFYVGWQWLEAGMAKMNSATWTGAQAGAALQGFVSGAIQKTAGAHPDVSAWYAYFLQHVVLQHTVFFSYLV